MKESNLVKRYAKALVLAMDDQAEFDRVSAELQAFLDLLAGDERVKIGLATSLISQAEKMAALDIVNAKMHLHAKTFQFLLTVAAENRLAYLAQMVQQLPDAWCAARGIEKIVVHSAVELAGDQKERLLGKLEKVPGQESRPGIRGGAGSDRRYQPAAGIGAIRFFLVRQPEKIA